jgi:LemA protein
MKILLLALVLLVAYTVYLYNKMVRLKISVREAVSQIDVQLKRRSDLIPNLVETVKGYVAHERGALTAVVDARSKGVEAKSITEKAVADNMLTGALSKLFALSESYPDLKANTVFLNLQEELSTTENKISFARQHYNDEATTLNNAVETIPTRFLSRVAGATKVDFFQAEESAKTAPTVKF